MKIELTLEGILALNDTLTTTPVKGRAEMRKHAKIFGELNAKCRVFDNEEKTQFHWKLGTVEWTDAEVIKYLAEIVDKRIDAGVNGQLSVGYAMLLDVLDKK